MSLRYAILGLLSLGDFTGYDLSKRFTGSIGFFWSAKHSQIYPELSRLSDEGLVTFQAVEQDSRPNKKLYSITDKGREELRLWLEGPLEPRSFKDPVLLRAFCASQMDRAELSAQLEETAQANRDRLSVYQEIEASLESQSETDPSHPWVGAYLTLRFAMMQASAYVAWCEWALDLLQGRAPDPRRGDPALRP